jgi:hypothetical protein
MLHLDLAAEANPLAATPADISSLQSWMMLPEIADNFAFTAEAVQFIAQRWSLALAFELRWSPEPVKHYLRDCSKAISAATARVVLDHFLL